MTIPVVLYFVALMFAGIDEIQAQGRSLTAWAVIFIALGLLWGVLKLG